MGADGRDAFARSAREPAPLDLRVNALKATRVDALAQLRGDGYAVEPTPYSPWGLRVSGRPALAQHPWFVDGSIEVQDEGSQLVAFLVAPRRGEMVVDFCAGAGGKTLALGVLMRSQGRLYAFDTVDKRLQNLKPRLARSGLSNVHPQLIAHERDTKIKRLAGKVDRVLVDAPCTGLGALRRRPEARWARKAEDLVAVRLKRRSGSSSSWQRSSRLDPRRRQHTGWACRTRRSSTTWRTRGPRWGRRRRRSSCGSSVHGCPSPRRKLNRARPRQRAGA